MIPYGRQEVTAADIEAVVGVLRSDFLTQGPAVPQFERAVADYVGAAHAVAMNSATSALHVACLALGLQPGQLLWTVPTTFVASANCARYCGAGVDFVDIDPLTWNMSVPALAAKLHAARRMDRLPAILVPVHLAGQPTEQEAIWELAQEFGVRVLEDASHSIGASRNGARVGNGKWSDASVFSFHPVKIITSGEGGMAVCSDSGLAERMADLRSHGITRDPARMAFPESQAPWYYEQVSLGFNYRMIDIEAALGLSQLARIDAYVARRNQLAKRYDGLLAGLPLQLPALLEGNVSAYHLYVVRLVGNARARHAEVLAGLRRAGIGATLHYLPVHLQPYYRGLGFHEDQFPEAEAYARSAISLPLYPALEEGSQDEVADALRELL